MTAPPASTTNDRIMDWLRLARLPNVFTAPGDSLAGLLLGCATFGAIPWGSAALVCLASCFFYIGGMILNDIADIDIDRRERPDRPLPSGRISRLAATNAFGGLTLLALALCAIVEHRVLFTGVGLLTCIVVYNLYAKHIRVLGPLSMGLCRGVNLLLGATVAAVVGGREAFLSGPVITGFYLLFIYISMVTLLARDEMTTKDPRFNRWLPLIVLFTGWVFLIAVRGTGGTDVSASGELYTTASGLLFVVLASVSIYLAWDGGRCIGITKRITPPVIGQWIGNLLFIQSAFILYAGHIFLGLALLVFWPLNRWVRKRIAAS